MRGGQRRGVWPFSTNPRLLSAQTGNCSSVPFSQRLIRKHKEGFSPRSKSKGQCLIGVRVCVSVCVCVCVCVCVWMCDRKRRYLWCVCVHVSGLNWSCQTERCVRECLSGQYF